MNSVLSKINKLNGFLKKPTVFFKCLLCVFAIFIQSVHAANPTVTSVTGPTNGTYTTNDTLEFIVNFSENVTYVSQTNQGEVITPYLELLLDSGIALATYKSTSASSVTFEFTPTPANFDFNGIEVKAIRDLKVINAATEQAINGLNNVADFSGVLISHGNFADLPQYDIYVTGDNLIFKLRWSKIAAVSITNGTPQLNITVGSTPYTLNGTATNEGTIEFVYTPINSDIDTDGVVVDSITLNGATITGTLDEMDDYSVGTHELSLTTTTFTNNGGILINAPSIAQVTSINVPANGNYNVGDVLNFTVNFDVPIFSLATTKTELILEFDNNRQVSATYTSGVAALSSWDFSYTLTADDIDTDGITIKALNGSPSNYVVNSTTLSDWSDLVVEGVADTSGITANVTNILNVVSVDVPAAKTYIAGDTLSFTVNYDGNVTVTGTPQLQLTIGDSVVMADYVSGSGTSALVFNLVLAEGLNDTDGIVVNNLILNGGLLQSAAAVNTNIDLNGVNSSVGVLVAVGAQVVSVGLPADASYSNGETLTFVVTFDNNVTVKGNAELMIDIDSGNRKAAYVSGSGTAQLIFSYDVDGTDFDDNGISVSALRGEGEGIVNDSNLKISYALNNVANGQAVLIDGGAPRNYSVAFDAANISSSNASSTSFTINGATVGATYNYSISNPQATQAGSNAQNPTVTGSGSITAASEQISGINLTTLADGELEVTLTLTSQGASLVGNEVSDSIQKLTSQPVVTSVDVPTSTFYGSGSKLNFTVNFDKAIQVTGAPQLKLDIGGISAIAEYDGSQSTTTSLFFSMTLGAGLTDSDGIEISEIFLNSGSIKDAIGDDVNLTLNNVGDLSQVTVIATATYHLTRSADITGSFVTNDTISITLNNNNFQGFAVTGAVGLELGLDSGPVSANYVSTAGVNIVFEYVIQSSDSHSVDNNISINALTFDGGSNINVVATFNAAFVLGALNADVSNLAAYPGVNINAAVVPVVSDISLHSVSYTAATYKGNDVINFDLKFSDNVDVTGSPQLNLNVGGTTRNAVYDSGTGTNTLRFSYTVVAGDNDLDGLKLSSIDLNGGSLTATTGGLALSINLADVESSDIQNVFVDTTAPLIASIQRFNPSEETTNADTLVWQIDFNEDVVKPVAADFEINNTTATLAVTVDSTDASIIYVTASGGDLVTKNGVVTLGIASGQSITDSLGNALTNTASVGSSELSYTMNNIFAAVSINDLITNHASPALTGTTDDAAANIVVVINGRAYPAINNGNGTWETVVNRIISLSEGTHVAEVQATNSHNNTSTDTANIVIDQTSPALAVITTTDLSYKASDQNAVQLAGTAEANSTLTLSLVNGSHSAISTPITVDANGLWNVSNLDVTTLDEGTINISITSLDSAGNTSVISSYALFKDVTAPTVTSILRHTPTTETSNADSLTWSVTFSENVAGVDSSDFELTGSTATLSIVESTANLYLVTAANGDLSSANGTVSLNLVVTPSIADIAGNSLTNITPVTNTNSFNLDNTAPTVTSIERFSPTTEATNSPNPTWQVTFSEAIEDINSSDFELSSSTAQLNISEVDVGIFTVEATGGDIATINGSIALTISSSSQITDKQGNRLTNVTPTASNNNSYTLDHTKPTVTVNSINTVDTTPDITGTINDNNASITIAIDGVFYTAVNNADGTWTLAGSNILTTTTKVLDDNAYDVFVRAVDAVGNVGVDTSSNEVTVDTVSPVVATITDTIDNKNINANEQSNASLTGTAEANSSIAVTLSDGVNTSVTANTTTDGSGDWEVTNLDLSTLNDGDISVSVISRDAANNSSSLATTISKDTVSPTITSITRQSPSTENTNADTVTWLVTFSEDVSAFTTQEVTITGTTATHSVTQLTAQTYQVTLQNGDLDNLNASISMSITNISAIKDNAENQVQTVTPTGDVESYNIDNSAPTINYLKYNTPTSQNTNATILTWEIEFSEDVSNVDANDFSVTNTTADLTLSAISAQKYQITAQDGDLATLDTTVTLGLSTAQNISDSASNALSNVVSTGTNEDSYILDHTLPSIQSSNIPDNSVNISITNLNVQLTMNENVTALSSGDNSISLILISDNSVVETFAADSNQVSIANNVVTLSFTSTLVPANEYGIRIGSASFIDSNGNTFAGLAEANLSFTTLNNSPVANNDSQTVNEDSSIQIDVLANDTDADGSQYIVASSVSIVDQTQVNGSLSFNSSNGLVTYTPTADFNGTSTFTYTVNDLQGALSNTATVTITVNAVNDAPVASDDNLSVVEDTATILDVLSNDSEKDSGDSLNSSTLVIVSPPSNGSAQVQNGSISYTPNSHFVGADSLTYTVNDTNAATSNTATVNLTITNVNDNATVSINGTVEQNQTITAVVTDIDGSNNSTISYQWQRAGNDISGATSNSYTLVQEDVGQIISVTSSFTDDLGSSENPTSSTSSVVNVNDKGVATITGTATEDQILTANVTDADGISTSALSYQWKRGGSDINGATSSSYTLVQEDVGHTITVVINYIDDLGGSGSPTSAATSSVANVNDTGIATITGTTTQGQTLTASASDEDGISNSTFAYQWKRNGNDIAGSTANTYTLVQDDVGQGISVTISFTDDFGGVENPVSSATSSIINVNDTGIATISGTAAEDQTLTASVTDADGVTSSTYAYQWKRNGNDINGATSSSYTLLQDDVGQLITVTITYTDDLGGAETISSNSTSSIANVNDPGVASITGTATQGQTLTASASDEDGILNSSFAYQWQRGGTAISGATSSSYTLIQADVGQIITVVISYSDDLGGVESPMSSATVSVTNINDVGVATISGTTTQGQTLSASATDDDGITNSTFSYQWKRAGNDISGATSATYTLLQDDVASTITVTISYTDDLGNAESVTSNATNTIANVNDSATAILSGTTTETHTLTVVLTDADGISNHPKTYVWKRSGTAISGATSSSYTLVAADIGQTITVTVSYTDDQGTAESVTSSATSTIIANNNAPTISGSPTSSIGDKTTYSFTPVASDPDNDSLTFSISNKPSWANFDTSTGTLSGIPGEAAIGTTTGIIISVDDGNNHITALSAFDITVFADLDGDNIADTTDTDIDGDGMDNSFEETHGLNPRDASDASTDLDNDGVTNLDEFIASTDPTVDDAPPVVTPPDTLTVNATGLYTAVDFGTATATDALDGAITPTFSGTGQLSPGVHSITWSATDAANNTGTATQTVNVIPLVNLSKDLSVSEGSSVSFEILLNGEAVTYPVDVPYTISGTASTDGSDHTLVNGSVSIVQPISGDIGEASVSFNVTDDGAGEGVETIVITLGTPTNAVIGANATQTIQVIEGNVAPEVTLTAVQNTGNTRIIDSTAGNVVVTAAVTDLNVGDTHTYDWSQTSNSLIDIDSSVSTFTFDPSGLSAGLYRVRLTVSDGTETSSSRLFLIVIANVPVLDTSDTDGDGIDDTTEGIGDEDSDGVPDYLDSISAPNVVQEKSATGDAFLMETEPGLKLSLGTTALTASKGKSEVTQQEIKDNHDGIGSAEDELVNVGGLFDFNITEIPEAGQTVNIVVAQFAQIPQNAVYRKLVATGWQDFVEDDKNSVSSAAGSEGFCPPPGDSAYQTGLTEGHWCVQLGIEDGGPNDTDGEVNNAIDDPGGVASKSLQKATLTSSGSGSVEIWMLYLLVSLLLYRLFQGKHRHQFLNKILVIFCAFIVSQSASAEELTFGFSLGHASGSEDATSLNNQVTNAAINSGSVTSQSSSRTAGELYLRFHYKDRYAMEMSYVDLGVVEANFEGVDSSASALITSLSSIQPETAQGVRVSAVHSYPLGDYQNIRAKIGAFVWHSEYTYSDSTVSQTFTESGADVTFGASISSDLGNNISGEFSWDRYRIDDESINLYLIGLAYTFK